MTKTRLIAVRVPEDLLLEVQVMLADPRTGRVRYGAWTAMMSHILRDWLDQQRTARTNHRHAKEFAHDDR